MEDIKEALRPLIAHEAKKYYMQIRPKPQTFNQVEPTMDESLESFGSFYSLVGDAQTFFPLSNELPTMIHLRMLKEYSIIDLHVK